MKFLYSLQIVKMLRIERQGGSWKRDRTGVVKTVSIMEFHFLLPNITASPGSCQCWLGEGSQFRPELITCNEYSFLSGDYCSRET